MIPVVVLPLPLLERILELLHRSPGRTTCLRLFPLDRDTEQSGWLAGEFQLTGAGGFEGPVIEIALGSTQFAIPPSPRRPLIGRLAIGTGAEAGRLAWFGEAPRDAAIELALVGPGMHRVEVGQQGLVRSLPNRPRHGDFSNWNRWSRTIGALGGVPVWNRLKKTTVCVVGCGRTGSIVASNLVRLGVDRILLADPDQIELHNTTEMDLVTPDDVGSPKVEAVARHLKSFATGSTVIETAAVSVTRPSTVGLLKRADVLIACPDSDAARLACGVSAALFHQVLIDVGTGIHFTGAADSASDAADRATAVRPSDSAEALPRNRSMGADIRLVLPGDGCLLCRGGLSAFGTALDELSSGPSRQRQDQWREQRAGSLRSLNQISAGLATRMLEDVMASRIQQSLRLHLEFDNAGRLTVEYLPTAATVVPCELCAKAGQGDLAMKW